MIDINNIAVPSIVETKYDDLKDALVRKLQEKIPGYVPHEADKYMPIIEATAYRELILRERINSAIKSMLLPSAEGDDLDLVGLRYGIVRNPGEKPRASIKLTLSAPFEQDKKVSADTVLTDSSQKYFARILRDIIFKPGVTEIEVEDVVELDEYVTESYAETTLFVNPVTYIKTAIVGKFSDGLPPESDEAFRKRIFHSLERFSTAGSRESYIYHAMSASMFVKDVHVAKTKPGHVLVLVQVPAYRRNEEDPNAEENTKLENIRKKVEDAVTNDRVRPLTDNVTVQTAEPFDIKIVAELELNDIQKGESTVQSIKDAFTAKNWNMGEPLSLSYLYKMLHADNVYRVKLSALLKKDGSSIPLKDEELEQAIDKTRYVVLDYDLSFKEIGVTG